MSEDDFDKIINDVRHSPFQQQLAARLGCPVEMVTVENLERVLNCAFVMWQVSDNEPMVGTQEDAQDALGDALSPFLAPFKREGGDA